MTKVAPTLAGRKPTYSWARRRPLPKWKQAEEYFKVHRDPKLAVTLPRVTCLEDRRHG